MSQIIKIKLTKIIAVVMALSLVLLQSRMVNAAVTGNISFDEVQSFIEAIDANDWNSYMNYRLDSEKDYYQKYFNDESVNYGVKMLKSISIQSSYEINTYAEQFMYKDEYPIEDLLFNYRAYILGLDCSIDILDDFFENGVNYYYILLATVGEEVKVVQFSKAPYSLINKYVSELSVADKNNIDRLVQNERALMTVHLTQSAVAENGKMAENDWPNSNKVFYRYKRPTKIVVKGYGEMNFKKYVRNVLPNEIYSNWEKAALQANAIAVEMVGVYHVQVNPVADSYHVADGTQKYVPDSSNSVCDDIYNDVFDIGMASSSYHLFFPTYKAGTKGNKGVAHSGELKQWGSQKLASEGYDYKGILNYYYSDSVKSDGNLIFFLWVC